MVSANEGSRSLHRTASGVPWQVTVVQARDQVALVRFVVLELDGRKRWCDPARWTPGGVGYGGGFGPGRAVVGRGRVKHLGVVASKEQVNNARVRVQHRCVLTDALVLVTRGVPVVF